MENPDPNSSKVQPYSLKRMLSYFLYLGAFGFGGPIALAGYMQRDLVEKKKYQSPFLYLG